MSYSRVTKLVREVKGSSSLEEAALLRQRDLDIVVGPGDPETTAVMASVATALALRCLDGEVRLHLPAGQLNMIGAPYRSGALADQLVEDAHIFGTPERFRIVRAPSKAHMRLGLGCGIEGGVGAFAAGWTAGVNRALTTAPAIAPASVLAVCCGFAKLFAASVLHRIAHLSESWSLSMADLEATREGATLLPAGELDLGDITLLGAGAIGSGFTFVLRLSRWRAHVEIIDKERYDEPNEETTLLVGRTEVRRRRHKAVALSELAAREGLSFTAVDETVSAGSSVLARRRDAFVCAVDNPETRRVLDHVNANVLLNAGVGGTPDTAGHVLVTRHLATDHRLSDLYGRAEELQLVTSRPPPKEVESDQCSRVAYENASLAVPFVGLAAGALLAAGCAQRVMKHWPQANYFKLDLLKLQASYHRELYPMKNTG